MSHRTRKPGDQRKAEIVTAALRLAGEMGPDRLTTEMLAREVGISQPGIFRHFPTKGDIWMAVAERIGQNMGDQAEATKAANLSPTDRLRHLVREHLRFLTATPAVPAILFSRELHAENDALRQFFARMIRRRKDFFARLISEEIAAGRFSADLDADDAAYLVLALIQGLAMRWSLMDRKFDLVAEGERLLNLLIQGFECS